MNAVSGHPRVGKPHALHAVVVPDTERSPFHAVRDAPVDPDEIRSPAPKSGGLLVVGGPPLGGKSVLATALAELLPRSVALIAVDSMTRGREKWYVHGPTGEPVEHPAAKMLTAAQSIWWTHLDTRRPTIIIAARFETPSLRARAQLLAHRVLRTRRFLFVEARSDDSLDTVRKLAERVLPAATLRKHLALYRAVCERYQPIDGAEAKNLSCLRLTRVRGDLLAALDQVLNAWTELV